MLRRVFRQHHFVPSTFPISWTTSTHRSRSIAALFYTPQHIKSEQFHGVSKRVLDFERLLYVQLRKKSDRRYYPVEMADNRYACDYAKRSTSSCKKCKKKIEKGELRLAKVVANFFHEGEGDMKQYHHPACLFETFVRARSTTKIIESPDDVEGFGDLEQPEKDLINQLIKETMEKKGSPKKATPKKATVQSKLPCSPQKTPKKEAPAPATSTSAATPSAAASTSTGSATAEPLGPNAEKDNSFRSFRRLCAEIAEQNSYNAKTKLVTDHFKKGSSGDGFQGDVYLWMKLLLPGVVKTVYNLNSKQLIKIFSQIFGASQEAMMEDLEQGDVAETVRVFFESSKQLPPQKKCTLSIQQVDNMLTELSRYTKEDDQQRVLTTIAKLCTANDLKMVVRLIKHDLRINAGAKHILEGLDPNAYDAFKASRNLQDVVDRVLEIRKHGDKPGQLSKKLSVKANLMTAVQPMLAEACKSVEYAFKKCPNGMYAEIKYDGERVQVHKQGTNFQYFSRSLKPVQPHKVNHFKDYIPKAFPEGGDLILDSEVLLIDTNTGNPLPFGTLGVHKKAAFKDATVCLFIFDCIHYNGKSLMEKPLKERRKILRENMTEIPNHIQFSEMKHITEPDDLKEMMLKVFREGLEGLVLKDTMGTYEPGKRHWLKVKKDYLAEGAMADSADLVVLGAYFGTGNKGGIKSNFLLGVYDSDTDRWLTVTKCHSGFDDKTLDRLQKDFSDMLKISKDYSKVPKWLSISRNLVPDFVASDPKKSPVWEITGAEFTKSEGHTADGISIRFPRCTKMREDKSWEEATDLKRLQELYKKSKEYSDIPDLLGSPKKGGKFRKKSNTAPLTKSAESDDSGSVKMEAEEDTNGNRSNQETPVKGKRKLDGDQSVGGTPVKKEKTETKPVCRYGTQCYQKSAEHLEQFSHPEGSIGSPVKPRASPASKNLPTVFSGMKIHIPESNGNYKKLKRYIIAFDGDTVAEYDKDTATHIVVDALSGDAGPSQEVTEGWLWQCIKEKRLIPLKS